MLRTFTYFISFYILFYFIYFPSHPSISSNLIVKLQAKSVLQCRLGVDFVLPLSQQQKEQQQQEQEPLNKIYQKGTC